MGTLIQLLLGIAVSSYAGYVLAQLWNWFVVPYFSVSFMSWGVAWGLLTLYRFIKFKFNAEEIKKARATTTLQVLEALFISAAVSSVVWAEGWFIHWYCLS